MGGVSGRYWGLTQGPERGCSMVGAKLVERWGPQTFGLAVCDEREKLSFLKKSQFKCISE